MNNFNKLQWANIAGLIGVVVINILANTLPINGITTGEVSDAYPNLFAPAGFTFAIWLVIYLLLGAFVAHQARGLFSRRGVPEDILTRVGYYFFASSLLNMAWIFAWHYERIGFSLLLMVLIFLSLAAIYVRLGARPLSRQDFLFVQIPFSVYFGWISVATIANVTTYLVSVNWQGFGLSQPFWAFVMVLAGALVALLNTWVRKDTAYLLVFVWAFIGIGAKRLMESPVYFMVLVAVAASLVLFGYLLYRELSPRGRS